MIKQCKVCKKKFECYDRPYKTGHKTPKRRADALTCSKPCSKKYARRKVKEYQTEKKLK